MTQSYVSSAKIEAQHSVGQTVLLVCFWLWGIAGLLIGTASILSLGANVGVGTSAYITMGLLFWIGGMVLFGLGTILVGFNYDFQRPNNDPARSSATAPAKPQRNVPFGASSSDPNFPNYRG